jgi:hypothetical protein
MAMILPVFLALVLGQIESMRLGMVAQLMTTAAREGCRVAVIPGRTQSDVTQRVGEVLEGSGIRLQSFAVTPSNWTTAPGGTSITVSLRVPYSNVSWLPVPRYLKTAVVAASATLSSERP